MTRPGGAPGIRRATYFTGATVLLAAAVSAASAHTNGPARPSAAVLAVFALLLAAADLLAIRFQYGEHLDGLHPYEAILAPLIFAAPGREVALAVAASVVLIAVVRRRLNIKAVFNGAMWVTAACVGQLVMSSLRDGPSANLRNLAVLAAALVAVMVVNQTLMAGVLWAVAGHPMGSASGPRARTVLVARAANNIASFGLGFLFVGAYEWQPLTLAVTIVPLAMMHWASRGHAAVRADRIRLAGLQRATHALAAAIDRNQAFAGFLAEVRASFEVSAVELVLFDHDQHEVHVCSGRVADGYSMTVERHELAALLADLTQPARYTTESALDAVRAALLSDERQTVIAAPLISSGRARGLLFLYDRTGMEGFEEGELAVAAALAAELVGFLQRSDLIRAVLDERRKLAEIVENTGDGILTIDDAGVIRSWNSALTTITGHGPEDMVGRKTVGILRMRDASGADVLLERWARKPDALPTEMQVLTANGDVVWLSCSYSIVPAAEGRNSTLVVVARNVTQARELERLKEDFVAVVSHELRTPLVGIRGWTQTLLTRGDRLTGEQHQQALQAMLSQAQRLEQLVLNILETSRIEAQGGGTTQDIVEVGAAVTKVVEEVVAARPDRVVRLRVPSRRLHVRGSAMWLERAAANLVSNAVKYSPDDQPVDVRVSTEDGEVVVRVTDRGPGIAREHRDRVFERFERLEETATQTGTGLGLYIARQLARAMGGAVTVDSVPGAGSTFTLRLPAVVDSPLPGQRVSPSTVVLS